jgi:hypothetical protein
MSTKSNDELRKLIQYHERMANEYREQLTTSCFDDVLQWINKQDKKYIPKLLDLHKHAKLIKQEYELNPSAWYQGYCDLEENLNMTLSLSDDIEIIFSWEFYGTTDQPEKAHKSLSINILINANKKPDIEEELAEFEDTNSNNWSYNYKTGDKYIKLLLEAYDCEDTGEPDENYEFACQCACSIINKVVGIVDLDDILCWSFLFELFKAPLDATPNSDSSMFDEICY